jgi:serine-type D-Ala-D-Ala carboxypeptidase (penicillin-binding protein 5/6)
VYLSTNRLLAALAVLLSLAPGPVSAARPASIGDGTEGKASFQKSPSAPGRPEVTCEGCLVIDDAGRVLWERHAHRRLANASTTKMVTALIVRRRAALSETVTVSANAAATGGGGLDLHEGESFSVDGLLHALLLTSSNDAAVALAEHVSGSVDRFVVAMNRLVRTLDLHDTHLVTPHGLDAAGHHASAWDLARIAGELLSDDVLAEMVADRSISIDGPGGSIPLENRNLLLDTYRGAIGVKTGYTADAGNVLVAAAVRHDRRLISVAMDSDDSFDDARDLLDFGFSELGRTVIVPQNSVVGTLVFDPGGTTAAVAERGVRGFATPDSLSISFQPFLSTNAPMERGEVVGVAEVWSGGRVIDRVSALAAEDVRIEHPSWLVETLGGMLEWAYDTGSRVGAW